VKAITIRQPWAWLIAMGAKPVENRAWWTSYRGPLLIHAAKGCTQEEWNDCYWFVEFVDERLASAIPRIEDLPRGGIVARVNMVDCIRDIASPWSMPPQWQHVYANPQPLPFYPCRGALGLWECALTQPGDPDARVS
jgi:hypothetical protein